MEAPSHDERRAFWLGVLVDASLVDALLYVSESLAYPHRSEPEIRAARNLIHAYDRAHVQGRATDRPWERVARWQVEDTLAVRVDPRRLESWEGGE